MINKGVGPVLGAILLLKEMELYYTLPSEKSNSVTFSGPKLYRKNNFFDFNVTPFSFRYGRNSPNLKVANFEK